MMKQAKSSRPWRGVAALAVLCAVLTGLLTQPSTAKPQDVNEQVAATRDVLDKWVETRRIISKERKDWALGKELLEERIALVQREIESLREKIAEADKSITDADKKKVELVAEQDKLKEASSILEDSLPELESKLRTLLPRLPAPIQDKVKSRSQLIPEDSAKSELSLSERYGTVSAVLNEVDKFNQEIHIVPDRRKLPSGDIVNVSAIYVGVSSCFYVSNNGLAAGIGRPTDDGWIWEAKDEFAKAIQDAIKMSENELPAAFVMLPVDVREEGGR